MTGWGDVADSHTKWTITAITMVGGWSRSPAWMIVRKKMLDGFQNQPRKNQWRTFAWCRMTGSRIFLTKRRILPKKHREQSEDDILWLWNYQNLLLRIDKHRLYLCWTSGIAFLEKTMCSYAYPHLSIVTLLAHIVRIIARVLLNSAEFDSVTIMSNSNHMRIAYYASTWLQVRAQECFEWKTTKFQIANFGLRGLGTQQHPSRIDIQPMQWR